MDSINARGWPKKVFLVVLLALALALTWFNGVERALNSGMVDFNILYGGAKLFVEGGNPYFSAPLQEILGPGVENKLGIQSTLPGVFGIMAPVGLLSHATASIIWLGLNLAGIVLSLYLLLKLAKLPLNSYHGSVLVVSCALVGAFRMGVRQGQLDNMVLAMVLLAAWLFWLSRSGFLAAILLGIAVTLKPTSTGLLAIYFGLRGKAVEALASLLLSVAIIAVCIWVLTVNVPEWWIVWADIREAVDSYYNRVSALNPRLELLTHLPAGLFALFKSATLANWLAFLVCGIVLLRTLLAVPLAQYDDRREHFLRELGIVAMVGLLVVYHRFYSAVFLVLPILWSVYLISTGRQTRTSWLLVILIPLVSVVNGQAAVRWFFERGLISGIDGSSWFEQVVLQFHFVWFQLLVMLLMFADQLRKTRFSVAVFKNALIELWDRFLPAWKRSISLQPGHD